MDRTFQNEVTKNAGRLIHVNAESVGQVHQDNLNQTPLFKTNTKKLIINIYFLFTLLPPLLIQIVICD